MSSLTDILTATKNLVSSVNDLGQTYLAVQGKQSSTNIQSATLVSSSSGRLASISVLVAGSAGTIYDSNTTTNLNNKLCVIPATVGVQFVNLPVGLGILVVPGSGQIVTISYS